MSNGASAQAPSYKVVLVVGAILLLAAILIRHLGIDFPYSKLLTYTGVGCVFYALGSTAAVNLNLPAAGQTASAAGAAAIAIFLSWTIGVDVSPDAKFNLVYYVNFPGDTINDPANLIATAEVAEASSIAPKPLNHTLHVGWGPAGPAGKVVKVTVPGISSRHIVTLKIENKHAQKRWSSASLLATESFMNVYESK